MSIKGRPYTNFQRALKTGDLLLIRAAAAELPTVNLQDALDVCLIVAEEEPELFERAALRWLARYCLERRDANLCLVLLEGEPERYGAWAARWASRFVHEAAGADVDEAALVLAALIALRGRARLAAARALEELCELGGQQRSAAVLERWLVDRAQASAASDADLT